MHVDTKELNLVLIHREAFLDNHANLAVANVAEVFELESGLALELVQVVIENGHLHCSTVVFSIFILFDLLSYLEEVDVFTTSKEHVVIHIRNSHKTCQIHIFEIFMLVGILEVVFDVNF